MQKKTKKNLPPSQIGKTRKSTFFIIIKIKIRIFISSIAKEFAYLHQIFSVKEPKRKKRKTDYKTKIKHNNEKA